MFQSILFSLFLFFLPNLTSLLFLLLFHPFYILILEVLFQPSFLILVVSFQPFFCILRCFIPTFAPYLSLQHSNLLFLLYISLFQASFFFRCNILTFLCCYTLFYSNLPFHHCFHYKKNYNLSFLFFVVLFQPTFVLLCHILTFLSCSSFFKSMQAFFLILCSFISTPTLIFPLNLYPFLSLLLIAKFSSLKTAEGNELLTFFHRIGSVDQPLCTGAIPFINIGILCKLKPGIPWFNEFILIILWLVWFGLV